MGDPSRKEQKRIQQLWHSFVQHKTTHCKWKISDLSQTLHHSREGSQSKRQSLFSYLMPSVYAAEAEIGGEDDEKGTQDRETMIKKMVSQRPEVMITDADVQHYLGTETARDRLTAMYNKNHKGDWSPELCMIMGVTKMTAYMVFFGAAVFGARHAREDFLRKNKHVKFSSQFRAQRAYRDYLLLESFKSGAKWALKTAGFSALFLTTSESLSVYRNKTDPLNYTVGGGLTGGILRLSLGMKGFIGGGVIGSTMGLVAGVVLCGAMWFANETQEQRHYNVILEKLREKKQMELLSSKSPASERQGS